MNRCTVVGLTLAAVASASQAQTYNSNAGGWNTGYGTVYGSFGLAQATQNMYNTMQLNMQRTTMRQAMINKWGLAAVEKAEREAAAGKSSPEIKVAPRPAPKFVGRFKPVPSVNMAQEVSKALGTNAEERNLYLAICDATITAFKDEEKKRGWSNDVAGALTLFIVTTSVIANGSEEPSEQVNSAMYDAVRQSMDEVPEFAKMSAAEKHKMHDLLLAFAGISLTFYADADQRKDADAMKTARQLAAQMLRLVLKVEPEKLKFTKDGIGSGLR